MILRFIYWDVLNTNRKTKRILIFGWMDGFFVWGQCRTRKKGGLGPGSTSPGCGARSGRDSPSTPRALVEHRMSAHRHAELTRPKLACTTLGAHLQGDKG